jgi:hypothetical protein
MATSDPFFVNLKQLPVDIQNTIWSSFFRLAAEEHAEAFKAIHDELSDYKLTTTIGNKIKLTICRANYYYAIMDIDDLWLNAYIYKYAIEAQLKRDCLRLLGRFRRRQMTQPVARFGDVIVDVREIYEGAGKTLGHYLASVPSVKDYTEDMNHYDRRAGGQIEWISYWATLEEMKKGPSIVGRGVSGLWGLGSHGLGTFGLESGTGFGSDDDSNDDSSVSDESS